MAKPTLNVIQGAWVAAPNWLDFPSTVVARSPFRREQACAFRIAKEDAVKAAKARRREAAFNLWSVILGEPPRVPLVEPFNAAAAVGLSRLDDAHACFEGLRRPCAEDTTSERMVAYILKPRFFYEYRPHPACVAYKAEVPADLVFAAYVKLDVPCGASGHPVKGVLTHWQFVEANDSDPLLPREANSRYDRRLW